MATENKVLKSIQRADSKFQGQSLKKRKKLIKKDKAPKLQSQTPYNFTDESVMITRDLDCISL